MARRQVPLQHSTAMPSSRRGVVAAALVVCAFATPLPAQAQPTLFADLALSIEPPLPQVLAPGATGTLRITVANQGPDNAGFTSQNAHPLVARTSLQTERPDGGIDLRFFPTMAPSDCILIATVIDPPPGGRPQWSYGLYFRPIAAGNSASCDVLYSLDPILSQQQIPITWRIRTFTETDPNPANDSVALVFNVGGASPPQPVPMLRTVGLVALLLAMLGMASRLRIPRRR